MKKLFFILLYFIATYTSWSQAPQSVNYQGVARNAQGQPYANQNIAVRLKIHEATATGTVVYSETRTVTTNAFGLFNVVINSAGATIKTGDFATINWQGSAKFLETEIDPAGGGNFTSLGTTQMQSVPFAIHSTSARQLTFPFDTTVTNGKYAFTVKNLSTDPSVGAIKAVSSSSEGGYAIEGTSVNSSGIVGGSTYSYGIYGHSQQVSGIKGYSLKENGIEGNTSSSTYAGVYGEGTNGKGVHGSSVNSTGVFGQSTNGTGVRGEGQIGVAGFSNEGTGVRAQSTVGLALEVVGKLKISGGNTNPGAGKVLTSDAGGNATWQTISVPQTPKVAFRVVNAAGNGLNVLAPDHRTKAHFANEAYDYGNDYNTVTGSPSSTFIAPVKGLYHFDVAIDWDTWGIISKAYLMRVRNGVTSTLMVHTAITNNDVQNYFQLYANGNHISTDIDLLPGDQVYVDVWFATIGNAPNAVLGSDCFFTGHLVFTN